MWNFSFAFNFYESQQIKAALVESTDLAERYARATYQIGQLECDNSHHVKRIQELEQQVKLLPDPTAIALLEQRLAHAEQALAAEQKKAWWQKLFG